MQRQIQMQTKSFYEKIQKIFLKCIDKYEEIWYYKLNKRKIFQPKQTRR